MRLHLFEFEDLKWIPEPVRSGATDYLRFLLKTLRFYEPAGKLVAATVRDHNYPYVLDLCSGGGGPAEQIADSIDQNTFILLTDKFPNLPAWKFISQKTNSRISYLPKSIDAFSESENYSGPRTMFSAIHHFQPRQIEQIIKNVSSQNHPLLLFDGGNKNIIMVLALLVAHPVLTILTAPFLKPFRLSRILFTWLIPLIPLVTIWDGLVSIIRLYSPSQLLQIARHTAPRYEWKAGYLKSKFGLRIAFLSGTSMRRIQDDDKAFSPK